MFFVPSCFDNIFLHFIVIYYFYSHDFYILFFISLLLRLERLLFLLALLLAVLVNSRQLSTITIRDHWIPNQWSLMVACRSCPPTVTGIGRLSHFCHVEFQPWTCVTYLTYLWYDNLPFAVDVGIRLWPCTGKDTGTWKRLRWLAWSATIFLTYLTIPA